MADPLLAERVAVGTGAGQGIGREIARSLRAFGANVVLVDIDGDAAKTAAEEVGCQGLARDLTSEERVRGVVTVHLRGTWREAAGYLTGTVLEFGGGRYL